jgi:hypothetical protein
VFGLLWARTEESLAAPSQIALIMGLASVAVGATTIGLARGREAERATGAEVFRPLPYLDMRPDGAMAGFAMTF